MQHIYIPKALHSGRSLRSNNMIAANTQDMDTFLELFDDPVIKDFLDQDVCNRFADKYLIAMVFIYFKRARYTAEEFTRFNFFVALYLAHDIEEDDEDLKLDLFMWALGPYGADRLNFMLACRDQLWRAIGYRALVSSGTCEMVMSLRPKHEVWLRTREPIHAGATRVHRLSFLSTCPSCNKRCYPESDTTNTGQDESSSEDDYLEYNHQSKFLKREE